MTNSGRTRRKGWQWGLVGLIVPLVVASANWSAIEAPRAIREQAVANAARLPWILGAAEADPAASGRYDRVKRAVAHRSGARSVTRLSLRKGVPRLTLYRTGFRAAEPTLGITDTGAIFYEVVPPAELGRGKPEVLRSADGGRTWNNVSPQIAGIDTHQHTMDPFIYVDERTSRIFNVDLAYPCAITSFSDDDGETWTTIEAPCGESDHQNIFTGPPATSSPVGYPNIVYYCAMQAVATEQFSHATSCMKSLDGGLSYTFTGDFPFVGTLHPQGPLGDLAGCGGGVGHGVVDDHGTVYLPRGWCGDPYLAISHDEGLTWQRIQVADSGMRTFGIPDHEAAVAVDRTGNIYYHWIAADGLPYLSISRDGGTTFEKPMMVAPPGVTDASLPSIDVGSDGRIAILYMGTTDGGSWNGYITMTPRPLAADPIFYSVATKTETEPLHKGECPPITCGPQYDFLDVVVASDGSVYGTFVDGCIAGGRCGADQTVSGRPAGEGILAHLSRESHR